MPKWGWGMAASQSRILLSPSLSLVCISFWLIPEFCKSWLFVFTSSLVPFVERQIPGVSYPTIFDYVTLLSFLLSSVYEIAKEVKASLSCHLRRKQVHKHTNHSHVICEWILLTCTFTHSSFFFQRKRLYLWQQYTSSCLPALSSIFLSVQAEHKLEEIALPSLSLRGKLI